MPVGDKQPPELLRDNEAWAFEPIRIAAELGHNVEWDPGQQDRWTCINPGCTSAVVRVGTNIYGSATNEHCQGAPKQ